MQKQKVIYLMGIFITSILLIANYVVYNNNMKFSKEQKEIMLNQMSKIEETIQTNSSGSSGDPNGITENDVNKKIEALEKEIENLRSTIKETKTEIHGLHDKNEVQDVLLGARFKEYSIVLNKVNSINQDEYLISYHKKGNKNIKEEITIKRDSTKIFLFDPGLGIYRLKDIESLVDRYEKNTHKDYTLKISENGWVIFTEIYIA